MPTRLRRAEPVFDARPSVILNFTLHRPWTRQILAGVSKYAQSHGGWNLILEHYDQTAGHSVLSGSTQIAVQGILGSALSMKSTEHAGRPFDTIPRVGLNHTDAQHSTPVVMTDLDEVGRQAADHLLDRSLEAVACYHVDSLKAPQIRERVEAFSQQVQARGGRIRHLALHHPNADHPGPDPRHSVGEVGDMLKQLPKPLGLFAVTAGDGWRALLAAQHAGLRVPEDLLIICGGDDELVFESLTPTLTGVLYDQVEVGYQAAQTLDRLMQGLPVPRVRLIPPLGVIERQSSEFTAVNDPVIEQAVRYIWTHVEDQLTVDAVANATAVSARTLSRGFRRVLQRTPLEEIRRSRVQTAKRLLGSTDLSMTEIALRSGYSSSSQLSHCVRLETGLTPTALRQQHLHVRR